MSVWMILVLQCFHILFYFILRERGRPRERGRERESPAGSSLSAQSPTRGSISRIVRSWPEPKSRVGCSVDQATRAPLHFKSYNCETFSLFHMPISYGFSRILCILTVLVSCILINNRVTGIAFVLFSSRETSSLKGLVYFYLLCLCNSTETCLFYDFSYFHLWLVLLFTEDYGTSIPTSLTP